MMQCKTDIVIVGYGNVGRGVRESIKQNSDMNLVGIISRSPERVAKELGDSVNIIDQGLVLGSKESLPIADVAILCGGSKNDLPVQGPQFARLYNTVDSFDTHANIPEYFEKINKAASFQGHTSIVCAGWDPGTFSVNRVLMNAFLPGAKAQEFYGLSKKGGLSMGHSDAIRQVEGVRDARQYTHAISKAMERVRSGENPKLTKGEAHWRECFVALENDTQGERRRVEHEIKTMKNYFEPYDTTVTFVSQEELDNDMPHDGLVLSVGKTGDGNYASIEYKNVFESNPEATGNILVACARACHKFNKEKRLGAYTMLDLSPADLSSHSQTELLRDFM